MRITDNTYRTGVGLYTIIERTGQIAIAKHEKYDNYEVFEIIKQEETKIVKDGEEITIRAGEFVPGNADWGKKGASVTNLDRAKIVAEVMAKQREERLARQLNLK